MTNIQSTEDYSSFKRISGNRTINKAQVKKLRDSFDENPDIASAVPILVNDKMEIIDGQHRFLAWKQLGMPIWYYQGKGLALGAVQIINSATKNWTPLDYARSYSDLGNSNYTIYLEFKNRYHATHATLLLALTDTKDRGNRNTSFQFYRGKFVAGDLKIAHEFCQRLQAIERYFVHTHTRSFAVAFKRASGSPSYEHERMMEKIQMFGAKFLKEAANSEEYMRQLEKVYNHHNGVESRARLY